MEKVRFDDDDECSACGATARVRLLKWKRGQYVTDVVLCENHWCIENARHPLTEDQAYDLMRHGRVINRFWLVELVNDLELWELEILRRAYSERE
jgi:hypothetical protein